MKVENIEELKKSLEKSFSVFQAQSALLEKAHIELKRKLDEANLSLERKNRELAEKIRETEEIKEKLSGILSSITDAVFLINADAYPLMWNKAAEELFPHILKKHSSLYEISQIADYLTTDKPIRDIMIEIKNDDSESFFLLSVIPVKVECNIDQRVISLKDITTQIELQEHLKREERLAALGKVAASVAHEIRNPLSAIEGFARLLEQDLKDQPSLQRLASKVVYGARQLNSVVSNLLNFTRDIKPSLFPCDINELILDALMFVKPVAEDHHVTLNIDLDKHVPGILADVVQMKQVITNIVLNAVDACPIREHGKINIRTYVRKKYLYIEISDNGPGVPKIYKEKIFEPFFTRKDGGIGLGLALCKRIIESHNGKIYECGEEGKGAKIVIRLRIATTK